MIASYGSVILRLADHPGYLPSEDEDPHLRDRGSLSGAPLYVSFGAGALLVVQQPVFAAEERLAEAGEGESP